MLHQAVAANQKEAALDIQSKELSQGSTCCSSHTSTHAVSDAGEVRASGTQEDPIQRHQLCPTEPCLKVVQESVDPSTDTFMASASRSPGGSRLQLCLLEQSCCCQRTALLLGVVLKGVAWDKV